MTTQITRCQLTQTYFSHRNLNSSDSFDGHIDCLRFFFLSFQFILVSVILISFLFTFPDLRLLSLS